MEVWQASKYINQVPSLSVACHGAISIILWV